MKDLSADFVRALDLHKERIRRLQEALCECPHREFFQADLHDETCPVFVIAATTSDCTQSLLNASGSAVSVDGPEGEADPPPPSV